MQNRLFTLVALFLWLCSMGWLFAEKILPSLLSGSPPDYEATLPPDDQEDELECWRVRWNGSDIGWSASRVNRELLGPTTISSKLAINDLALGDVLPPGFATLLRPFANGIRTLNFRVSSDVILDAMDELSSFQTTARLDGFDQRLKVIGNVIDGRLQVSVYSGEFVHKVDKALPEGALVSNELAPYAYLRNLHIGQTWSVPVYSPFNSPTAPLEMVQATVQRYAEIHWNHETVQTLLVVFRDQESLAATSQDDMVGKMWVREDGYVLRQELDLLGKRLTFERMTEEEAAELDPWASPNPWASSTEASLDGPTKPEESGEEPATIEATQREAPAGSSDRDPF